jgi:phosphatidylserine/phosphatidylglycerophosphate/cardiolipin synthase-like enzyme
MTTPDVSRTPDSPSRRWTGWLLAALVCALLVMAGALFWFLQFTPAPAANPPATLVTTRTAGIAESTTELGASPAAVSTPVVAAAITTGIFIEPGDGRAPLLDEIAAARHSIDLEVYIVSDEAILRALEDAARRGVAVRVILEEHPFGGAGGQEAIFTRLEEAGIAVRWGNPVFRFTHIKTMIVDNAVAIIMNQNLTASAFSTNRDFGVITTEPDAVRTAAAIFAADWERGPEPDPAPLVVSPTNARAALTALVQDASETLDVYAEVLRDPEVLDALAAAERRGVTVRVIVADSSEFAAERAALSAAGVEVRLANSLYIHAKVIIADGEQAFVGSQNLSATSLDQNRELGIVVDDPVSLGRLTRTFEIDFRVSATPVPGTP